MPSRFRCSYQFRSPDISTRQHFVREKSATICVHCWLRSLLCWCSSSVARKAPWRAICWMGELPLVLLLTSSYNLKSEMESAHVYVDLSQNFVNFSTRSLKTTNRSILSRGVGVGECGSSFRCNNPQWPQQAFYPTSECTTLTPHHHHHHYTPHHQQLANGSVGTGLGISSTQSVNAATAVAFNQFGNCRATIPPPHGRLQKSLSFAFQTPDALSNEIWQPNWQAQMNGSINYPVQRNYSRWAGERVVWAVN